jgi:hypothetical protein
VPDHSTFSKNRHGRFRESDLLRKLFETVVARCVTEGLVGGEAFGVDASMIVADACRRRGVVKVEDLDPTSSRAVAEYLSVLDDAAFGGATPVEPKSISPTDPAARYTAAADTPTVYAYSDKYLVDLKNAVIMDVEAMTAVRPAEVGAAKTMLDRTAERLDVTPSRLVADAGYGSADMVGWLVDERGIEPHVKVFDKSERKDGTFSRSDFAYDAEAHQAISSSSALTLLARRPTRPVGWSARSASPAGRPMSTGGRYLLALVILRMVLDDRLPKALANRDVIEPLERETRVNTGASLCHRPDDMRRSAGFPQRFGNRNNTLPVRRSSLSAVGGAFGL